MPSTVEQLTPTRVKLTIEMPFTELQPAIDKAYADIAQQVKLPGFRKGHVPHAVIDQRFGRGMVLQEAINDALPNAYGAAVNEHDLRPLGQPDIDVTKLEDNDVVEFTAEVDVRPAFDLPEFSSVSVTVPSVSASDDDVNERIGMLRERFAVNTDVDRAAAEGDLITVDLEGRQNGEILDDATATGIAHKVGSEGMIDGFDDAVKGLKVGESATFTSKLLGGAHKDQDADITVTVTKVQEQELPEVDDEFAQMVSQFDTVDEMKADLKASLEQMSRLDQAAAARDKVLEEVINKVDFELPQAVVDSELEARKEQVNQQLSRAGLTVDDYLEQSDDETAETPEEFWAEIDKGAINALRAQIILDKLADEHELQPTQEELTQLIFRKAQENRTTPDQEAQHMVDHNHLPEWIQEIRRSKALSEIVNAATIVDEDGNSVDLSRLAPDGTIVSDEELAEEQPADAEPADEVVEQTTEA